MTSERSLVVGVTYSRRTCMVLLIPSMQVGSSKAIKLWTRKFVDGRTGEFRRFVCGDGG